MEPKPGFRTTELAATAIALTGVNFWTQTSEFVEVQVAGVYASALIVGFYIVSRGLAKIGGAK